MLYLITWGTIRFIHGFKNASVPPCSPTKSLVNSIKGQKLTNKASSIRLSKLCVLLFIKTSGMSIRAFLYSRKAVEGSAQTQWPPAILLVDNDPDTGTGTLPISQTSNKAKHSLSSTNNLHAAVRVMDRPASSEYTPGNKAPSWSSGTHPAYRSATVRCLMAHGDNDILVLHPQNTQRQRVL